MMEGVEKAVLLIFSSANYEDKNGKFCTLNI